jgi:GNAT superfamily N-acetyltransferase
VEREPQIAHRVDVRPLTPEDVGKAGDLLDGTVGVGYWHLDLEERGVHLGAYAGSTLIGVATVCVRERAELEADYAGCAPWPGGRRRLPERVALLSLIAVEPTWRGQGVADRLLDEAERRAVPLGIACGWVNAWVHAETGACPASRLLLRHRYRPLGFVAGFFAGMSEASVCLGCLSAPCRCGVRVYSKEPE